MTGGCGFCTGFGQVIIVSRIDDVAMVFRLRLGPDLLHRLDLLAHLLHAGGKDGAVVLDLLLVPAAADAEQEPPARHLVDRGDELGGLDRVALDDEAHAGGYLELLVAPAAAVSVTNGSITS